MSVGLPHAYLANEKKVKEHSEFYDVGTITAIQGDRIS